MPRIVFTIPVRPGRQEECMRILAKYKRDLDRVHQAIGAVQWIKLIDRDQYVEIIEWRGRSFDEFLADFLSRRELEQFITEITPHLLTPKVTDGEDPVKVITQFHKDAAMREAYCLVPAPR
jgi:hypothetical protein